MRHPALRVYKPFVDARVPAYHLALVRDEGVPYEGPRVTISGPEDVGRVCADLRGADRECGIVLLLSTRNSLIAKVPVAQGSLNATVIHPREVYKPAVVANAAAIVFVHNHPSGDVTPSGADCALVRRLARAGDQLGIELLDACIVPGGEGGEVCSMREMGLLP